MPCCAVALRLARSKAGRCKGFLGDDCAFQPRVTITRIEYMEECREIFPWVDQFLWLVEFLPLALVMDI